MSTMIERTQRVASRLSEIVEPEAVARLAVLDAQVHSSSL